MSRRAHKIPSREIALADLRVHPSERKSKSFADIKIMATDLASRGLRSPLVVTQATGGGFYVIDGRVRLQAAKTIKWKKIPCVVLPDLPATTLVEIADIITNLAQGLLQDHELARRAVVLRDDHHVPAANLADILGRSRGYTCNLVRWWESSPNVVRRAWQDGHPALSQTVLERLSQNSRDGAAKAWQRLLAVREGWTPGKKHKALASHPRHKMEREVESLDTKVEAAKIAPPTKLFVRKVLGFLLGRVKGVPGVTDKKRGVPREIRA